MMSKEQEKAAAAVETATEAAQPAAPAAGRTDRERQSAALAAVLKLDGAKEDHEAEVSDQSPDSDGGDEAKEEAKGEAEPDGGKKEGKEDKADGKAERVSTLLARLAKQDKELQSLRSRLKSAVPLDDIKSDPLKALQEAGYGPQQVLDLWLGTPAGDSHAPAQAADADGKTPAELAALQREVETLKQALQARDQAERAKAAQELYRNELGSVHSAVAGGGDRWEMISARRSEGGLASNGGGSYDLAVETAQAIYRKRIEALGPRPTREEISEAAPAWGEVLDLVEKALVDDWNQRHSAVAKVKKLQAAPAKPAPRKSVGLPSPSAPTPRKTTKQLTDQERWANAMAAIERLDREGVQDDA